MKNHLGRDGDHILLVDDDPNDIELTMAALQDNALENRVVVLRNGAAALDYLYRRGQYASRDGGDPAVILLDNKMPKVSGLEVIECLKRDEHLKRIPVVALTSSRERRDLAQFYELGVNAYVVKPVDFAEFYEAVQQLGIFWTSINELPPKG